MTATKEMNKIVVIMGSTGVGKSKLSIELATSFPSEIINCDKMQVYTGLDVTTNKLTPREQLGVAHHLLAHFDPAVSGEVSNANFRIAATSTASQIHSRRRIPIAVGGSTSFIHALVSADHDSPVETTNPDWILSISPSLRYDCCFIWVDVALPVLFDYLGVRLDDMINGGMFDELADFYNQYETYTSAPEGLRKSIGVPEFEDYFRRFGSVSQGDEVLTGDERKSMFEEARKATKDNTCELAKMQVEKIKRLKGIGWDIRRLDATEVFKAMLASDNKRALELWNKDVAEPAMEIVEAFLKDE
ncbi:hypothetical protein Scep_016298 [Stephania cephalantha]|uniref:Adenylate isopentenyltransferase n=1 Tax=Stephania cephalantha TaxID=152367 RepID=A0AAP0IMX3_9MAGN